MLLPRVLLPRVHMYVHVLPLRPEHVLVPVYVLPVSLETQPCQKRMAGLCQEREGYPVMKRRQHCKNERAALPLSTREVSPDNSREIQWYQHPLRWRPRLEIKMAGGLALEPDWGAWLVQPPGLFRDYPFLQSCSTRRSPKSAPSQRKKYSAHVFTMKHSSNPEGSTEPRTR
jgi:hypothetical protein